MMVEGVTNLEMFVTLVTLVIAAGVLVGIYENSFPPEGKA
jgi:Mg2+/citrate symporter